MSTQVRWFVGTTEPGVARLASTSLMAPRTLWVGQT